MTDGSALSKARVFARAMLESTALARRKRPDLVYLHVAVKGSVYRKCCVTELAIPRGLPFVLHTHGGDFNAWFAGQPILARRLVARMFRRADQVIALSSSWAAYYRETFGLADQRVTVLPNPVHCPDALPDRAGRRSVSFLFLGSMDERKGAFRALRGFCRLPEDLKARARLVLAGNGRVSEIRAEAAAAGVSDRVEVRDWLDPRERDAALAESDVYLLPSTSEGLPMGMLEAMSWGLAVITSPVGGIPEVIRHDVNGLLVAPMDERGLTEAMARVIVDEPYRARLAAAAVETARRYDVGGYWARLYPVLRSVAALGGRKAADA
jgi:glycosyltransferase involved in cell wall biosynthesis